MSTFNNIPTGLIVPSQVPLDGKILVASEAVLANLGTNDNLAYTYYDGLIVYCVLERTRYEWREWDGLERQLVPGGYTYPAGHIVNGVDYSNKTYNFIFIPFNLGIVNLGTGVPVYQGINIGTGNHKFASFKSKTFAINLVSGEIFIEDRPGINVGGGAAVFKAIDSLTGLKEYRTMISLNGLITVVQDGDLIKFNTTLYNTVIQAGTGISVTGTGTGFDPYIITNTEGPAWLTGDTKEVICDPAYIAANFVSSGPTKGLGKNLRLGWAIINGLNGTPTGETGRVTVAWGDTAPFNVMGHKDGAMTHVLSKAEMPKHDHVSESGALGDGRVYVNDAGTGPLANGWSVAGNDELEYIVYTGENPQGNNQAHNIMQPYVVRLRIMKL